MAKERLSRLQKFILLKGYKDCGVMRRHFLEYYGLCDPMTYPSNKKALGNANRVTMLRCKRNMLASGLIKEVEQGRYIVLTDKGVNTLKANDCVADIQNISIKDYQQRVEEWLKEAKQFHEQVRLVAQAMSANRRPRRVKS